MGFIRSLTGALALSAYHGPSMSRLLATIDLLSVANSDIRHLVGRELLGRKVWYPDVNPAPDPSIFRTGLADSTVFLRAVREAGLAIAEGAR